MGVTESKTCAGPFRLDDIQGMDSGFRSRPPQFFEAAYLASESQDFVASKGTYGRRLT
jgi:hypothetical protein